MENLVDEKKKEGETWTAFFFFFIYEHKPYFTWNKKRTFIILRSEQFIVKMNNKHYWNNAEFDFLLLDSQLLTVY